jgi:predicted RNA-binding protein YlqC (UPF0109 family)
MTNELIQAIVTSLVDYPDHIVIDEKVEGKKVTYRLSVHKEDMGKIIGKHGRVAKAIRSIVYAAATNENKHINLEIV